MRLLAKAVVWVWSLSSNEAYLLFYRPKLNFLPFAGTTSYRFYVLVPTSGVVPAEFTCCPCPPFSFLLRDYLPVTYTAPTLISSGASPKACARFEPI